jgi:hypothetical protein
MANVKKLSGGIASPYHLPQSFLWDNILDWGDKTNPLGSIQTVFWKKCAKVAIFRQ